MKIILLIILGSLFGNVHAEIWEKPPYKPDEGHLQEQIERQEEPQAKKEKQVIETKKHQEIRDETSIIEKVDDQIIEDEKAVP